MDQSGSYIFGNVASKRRVKLWVYFKQPERLPWNLQKELIKRQSIAPGPGHPCHGCRPFRIFWALCCTRAGWWVGMSVHRLSATSASLFGCSRASSDHRAWQLICFLAIIQDGVASGPCLQHHWGVSLWKFPSVSFSRCWLQPVPKARPSKTSVT